MSQHNVFLALAEELYAEALEIAVAREISISDLLIEALSDSIERQRRDTWTEDRLRFLLKASPRIH